VTPDETAAPAPRRVALARTALAATAWLLAAGVLGQLLTAGYALFVAPGWWARHRDFVHAFEWLAPLAVILAYVARTSRGTKGMAWLTVALLFAQYATAGVQGAAGRAGLAVLHPVGAAVLFWAAMELGRRARREAVGHGP
jgi:hypothetical protein